jgi:hypothetical protein
VTEGKLATLRLREDRRLAPNLIQQLQRNLPAKVRLWLALAAHDRVVVSLRTADSDDVFGRLEQVLNQLAVLPLSEEARRHQQRMDLVAGG